MGYSPYYGAPFFWCWSEGDALCWEEPSGKVNKYPANLGFRTDKQLNKFEGMGARWVLQDDEHSLLYVGTHRFTWSAFDITGTLVRRGSVEYDNRVFGEIGQWGHFPAMLDLSDKRTVYTANEEAVYRLHQPWRLPTDIPRSYAGEMNGERGLIIYTEGGVLDVEQAGAWISTPRPPRPVPRIRL